MIEVYTDGATEGHNGKLGTVSWVGLGIYIPDLDICVSKRVRGISNNEAEYMALIEAMDICKQNGLTSVLFLSDSMNVVNGAQKNRPTKNLRMSKFKSEIQKRLSYFTEVEFAWIPREENEQADILSKESLLMV